MNLPEQPTTFRPPSPAERPWWWKLNLRGYAQMVRSAGFELVQGPKLFLIPAGAELKRKRVGLRNLRAYEGRQALIRRHAGDPHAFILARRA